MRIGASSARIQGVEDTLLRHRTKLAEAEALLLALQRGKSDPQITSTKQIKAFIDRQDLEIRKLETALLAAIEGNVSRGVQQDLEDQLRRARDELVLAEERLDERLRHKGKAPRPRRARGTRRARIPAPMVPRARARMGGPPALVPHLGAAPVINVANSPVHPVFSTTWAGLTFSMVDIQLQNGIIRATGHSATITCEKRGSAAKGDISEITKFIKKHFKLGGTLDGRRMTSQRLIRTIVSNLPGTFAIQA